MVLLQHTTSSRKRSNPNSFIPPLAQPPKLPKNHHNQQPPPPQTLTPIEKMASVLAEAGCTLINSLGPPCLPPDCHKLRNHLQRLLSDAPGVRSEFLSGFASYVASTENLRRILLPTNGDSCGSARTDSLVRVLLLVPSIQLDIQTILLEKMPEYFDLEPVSGYGPCSLRLDEDIARLILNQFRWLDFLVDSEAFTNKLLEVLSICPLYLKREIIGSLPELIGEQNNESIINSLEEMLQNDPNAIIVPVLDSISNFNLNDLLQDKVTTLALSYLRTIDAEHMPYLLKFLLLSATPMNIQRIISKIREQLKNFGVSNLSMTQHNKLKGKSVADNVDGSILDALRSSLRFKNMLCQEILKELKSLGESRDHKMIDIWLLMLIYMNGETMQKTVEKMIKRKIVEGCIQDIMFEQCIRGNKRLVQDFFASFLCLSEFLLACKEPKAREVAIHMYNCLFEVFADTYSRQEVLGSIVTHIGSGSTSEVDSALDVMILLASKYSQEMLPLSSHISGVLDYLEGFNVQSLHKVYEIFCLLAMSARSSAERFASSIANELLMIIRKQVGSPDLKYKTMGLIGTMKMVSFLADVNISPNLSSSQKSNNEEALELLKISLDSCKQLPLPSIIFYDELISMLNQKHLHPEIMEWIGRHVGEFESRFLSDLEDGKLSDKESYFDLEGELWMNLDGDVSPICLNILPLVASSMRSASPLQILPAHFLLLSTIERLANQGSLGGIDALLGCPLHLPSSKLFLGSTWKSLSDKQKQVSCLCLYYAVNWMRELINAFCTQVAGRLEHISQATEKEIVDKLLKRLRDLIYLESLLNAFLKKYPVTLPELYPHGQPASSHCPGRPSSKILAGKPTEHNSADENTSQNNKRKYRKTSKLATNSDTSAKGRQPTIMDVLKKAGVLPSVSNDDSSGSPVTGTTSESSEQVNTYESEYVEVSASTKYLEVYRCKFRPLLVECFSMLSFSQSLDSCCADPSAELPLHLYLLRDLNYKLEYFSPTSKHVSAKCSSSPPGLKGMTLIEFLSNIRALFPTFRRHFNSAICVLKEGDEACQEHWKVHSLLAGIPDISNMVVSKSSVSTSVFIEILHCYNKMLNLPDILTEKLLLSDLLESLQPLKVPNCTFSGMNMIPASGSIDYLYIGAYSFLAEALDVACTFSFTLASEVLLTMNSVVTSVEKYLTKSLEEAGKGIHAETTRGLLSALRIKLGISAQKLLRHDWNSDTDEDCWKRKGELVQRTVHIYLGNCESTSDLLIELAQSILPKVSSCKKTSKDDSHGFPTLCAATFIVWYRELHEENISILDKLVKEVVLVQKSRVTIPEESIEKLLTKLRQSVGVFVSLINMCRTHNKVTVHALAIKYGGKFIESFLKVFDFLKTQFDKHNERIVELVRELPKATRTIQTLCSEAKSLKQTVIASKIPATKRSLERFLFQVKALFHSAPSGCKFSIENLRHKDLTGQIVSSQAYIDQDEDIDKDFVDTGPHEHDATVSGEEDGETE
ncbi:Fanconi anemia group D2 protein-like [Heracleum sosnowskyi]|uniref:Fanconi anemia group D2 protein-like n=1 Tax=Heracleum sosnowskyi TaxID=360622 RepID=A0AAD8MJB5_9APIA|nr:Fanconi anemia group D2 protein-like [Heracleum sosnowskyi]